MGGLVIDVDTAVYGPDENSIQDLYAAGEVVGDVQGSNCLSGNSSMDCLVVGRVVAKAACKWMPYSGR